MQCYYNILVLSLGLVNHIYVCYYILSLGLCFGSDLCKDVPNSKYRIVPDILYVCTQEIERQLQNNHGM